MKLCDEGDINRTLLRQSRARARGIFDELDRHAAMARAKALEHVAQQ